MTDPSLADYVKHAERFGIECICDTAEADGLSAFDLGCVARHLRRIDTTWRLTREQRERLILRLLADRVTDKEIRDMAGVSQDTVSRLRKQSQTSDSEDRSPVSMRHQVRKLTWDRQHPYQTVSAYLSDAERRSWPTPTSTIGGSPVADDDPRPDLDAAFPPDEIAA